MNAKNSPFFQEVEAWQGLYGRYCAWWTVPTYESILQLLGARAVKQYEPEP